MLQRLKNSFFLMLVLIFLAPSIVKLGHEHKEFLCNAKTEKHFHTYHENCEICQFAFSLFKSEDYLINWKTKLPTGNYSNTYCSLLNTCKPKFLFQLRAPPISTF